MLRCIFFLFLLFLFFHAPAEAKKEKKAPATLIAPGGVQPYPHQWFETKTKKSASVFGQAYRPRDDLAVLEMFPQSDRGKRIEIKSVRIKTASGKIYEAKIRRLPSGFMPTARQNYRQPAAEIPVKEVPFQTEPSR